MNSEISSTPEPENTENIIFEPAEPSDLSQADEAIAKPDIARAQDSEVSSSRESEREVELADLDEPIGSTPADESVAIEAEEAGENDVAEPTNNGSSAEKESTELFVDTWLDESEETTERDRSEAADDELERLKQEKASLQLEVTELKATKEQLLSNQMQEVREKINHLLEEGTQELIERKTTLRIEIEKLERRKARIEREMRSNFAGSSKELAIKVQGFKEYLVGSLQDLATAADKLDLVRPEASPVRNRDSRSRENSRVESRSSRRNSETRGSRDEGRLRRENDRDGRRSADSARRRSESSRGRGNLERSDTGQFAEPTFADHSRRIRQLLDQYCNSPDYYGAPWQLRRTFDRTQARKVQEWFFAQGGRGAIDSMGSRLQNILIASAVISILHNIYRDRTQVLILTDTPENLGEWRKGLEDCLGISRRDFGANRGVVLFDSPEVLVQRAERLIADKLLPVIVIDETEDLLNLSMLKFPIWLAFAATNKPAAANYLY